MHRTTVITTLLLVVVLSAAILPVAVHAQPQEPPSNLTPGLQPAVTTRVYVPLVSRQVPTPSFGYGVQVNPWGNTAANIGHVHALGFGWVKAQMLWKDVEPTQGDFRWGDWDAFLAAYRAAGVKVLLSITAAPEWARPADTILGLDGPPADNATFANFLRELCLRYRDQVHAIEVWSEQNVFFQGGGKVIPPAEYVAMLGAAYGAIKAVDPRIVVVSGAATPSVWNDGPYQMDDLAYLNQMYAAGLKGKCDAIGAHASGYNNPPDATVGYTNPAEPIFKGYRIFFFRGMLEAYRAAMVANGDGATKIWATEFGWASDPNAISGYDYARDNTLEEQASYTVQAYQMAKAWGWVGAMFLWNLDYGVTHPNTELSYWSLLRPDPVPAYGALAAMPK